MRAPHLLLASILSIGALAYLAGSPAVSIAAARASAMQRPAAAQVSSHAPPVFKKVLTSGQALADLTGEPMKIPPEEALRRLSGLLIGPDGKTAGMIVMVNAAGAADRKSALQLVRQAAAEAGIAQDERRRARTTRSALRSSVTPVPARHRNTRSVNNWPRRDRCFPSSS